LYRQRRPHALPINQNRVRALCRGGMLRLLASRMATSVALIDAPNARFLVKCIRAVAARACNQQSVQQMISSQTETLRLRQRWIDSLAQGSECEARSSRMLTSNDTWRRRFAQRSTWLLLVRADEPFTMASAPLYFLRRCIAFVVCKLYQRVLFNQYNLHLQKSLCNIFWLQPSCSLQAPQGLSNEAIQLCESAADVEHKIEELEDLHQVGIRMRVAFVMMMMLLMMMMTLLMMMVMMMNLLQPKQNGSLD
jgi:hypothetical protein